MQSTIVKKVFLIITLFIVVSLACDLSVSVAPSTSPAPLPTSTMVPVSGTPTLILSTLAPNATATEIPASATLIPTTLAANTTPAAGTAVTFWPLSLVLPPGVAGGASGSQISRADGQDLPYWELTPGHTEIKLDGYLLQGKFHEPKIYVYPALGYAQLFPGAFESMHRLRNVMNEPGAVNADQLPAVPFFNAAQVFASNIQAISFLNGDGVRFLTEYAQYAAPVNNHELIYHFQGFTDDGEYYVVAILPITVPILAETSDAGAPLPAEGIPYPFMADPNADMQSYYASVTDLLNSTPPEAFAPTINQLDSLIQSIRITP